MNLYAEDPHYISNKKYRPISFLYLFMSFAALVVGIIFWSIIFAILLFIGIIIIAVIAVQIFFKKKLDKKRRDILRG